MLYPPRVQVDIWIMDLHRLDIWVTIVELDAVGWIPKHGHYFGFSEQDRITLNPRQSGSSMLWTLFHELGHMYLHLSPRGNMEGVSWAQRELEADWVAQLLCQHYDISTPFPDIQDQHKETLPDLLQCHPLEYYHSRVERAVEHIIDDKTWATTYAPGWPSMEEREERIRMVAPPRPVAPKRSLVERIKRWDEWGPELLGNAIIVIILFAAGMVVMLVLVVIEEIIRLLT